MSITRKIQKAVYSWEIPPEPITDVKREVHTEILVVGAGVAGVVTALIGGRRRR